MNIYDTILFAQGKGICVTTEKFYARSTRCNAHYHIHKLEDGNSRPTIAGDRFYIKLPAYIQQIKACSPLKRNLKRFLTNQYYYSIHDVINVIANFTDG